MANPAICRGLSWSSVGEHRGRSVRTAGSRGDLGHLILGVVAPVAGVVDCVSGLVAGLDRKNGRTLAERAGDVSPDGMQRLRAALTGTSTGSATTFVIMWMGGWATRAPC